LYIVTPLHFCPVMKLPSRLRAASLMLSFGYGVTLVASAAPGDLDPNFGTGGLVTASFTPDDDYAYSIAVQADGKILVAGGSAAGDYSVLRLLSNGNPDPDFGTAGKFAHSFGQFELARGVAGVSGGKILVGGSGLVPGGLRDFAVLRLAANGTLDTTGYGTGGIVTTDISGGFNDTVTSMAVDGGGRAVLAGYHRTNFALVRYTSNGGLDDTFGTGGKVFTGSTTTTEQQANAIALQTDGKIVIAGSSRTGLNTDVVVARYLTNGTPDPDFGTGGQTILPVGEGNTLDVAHAVAVLPDGKILVAGTTANDYLLLRFTSTGALDTDFGAGGGYITGFTNSTDAGYALSVQSDGRILLAGSSVLSGREYFGLLRFTPDGLPDGSFVNGGGTVFGVTAGADTARAIALQSDGRILVAGYGGAPNVKDFAVARVESAAPLTLPSWRQLHFGTTANSGNAANDFDFDKDGLVNLLEYAFGQDPTKGVSRAVPSGAVNGANFVSNFTVPPGITGITYAAEWSPSLDMGTWTAVSNTGTAGTPSFSVPVAGKPKLYLRWKITVQ
jgi:uncharacterized delta-60 repeat protein